MDPYAEQVHDYNPGNLANGVFWTKAIDPSFDVDVEEGRAVWVLNGYAITDFTNFENSLASFSGPGGTPTPGKALLPPKPGNVSFDLRWEGVKRRYRVDDPAQRLRGEFVEPSAATIRWSGRTAGYSFVSDPVSEVFFAQLGEERNGVFFQRG
ncbi:MAG: hypothetical protein NVS2B9_04380 [Myxococcales bacterium]